MSHIDKALKKAQKEKDNIYQRYSLITPVATRKNNTGHKTGRVFVAVFILISLAAIVLLVFGNNAQNGKENKNRMSGQRKPVVHVFAIDKHVAGPDTLGKTEQRESSANNLYKKALDWYQKGNLDKAGEEYKKVLSIEPKHVFALNNLGVIYMSKKRNKEAANMFRKAIGLKDDYVDPYYNMACLYSKSGNISKSLYYLKIAISINNSVKNWAKNDKDLEELRVSETYKKIME